jgi:hypothetical protein
MILLHSIALTSLLVGQDHVINLSRHGQPPVVGDQRRACVLVDVAVTILPQIASVARVDGRDADRIQRDKLSIRRGESGSLAVTAGFRALQTLTLEGAVKLSVPDLNFFEVEVRLPSGRHEMYANIDIAEQPPSPFHPPGRRRLSAAPHRLNDRCDIGV